MDEDIPKWYEYDCNTYNEICSILSDKHNANFTRNVIQNIALKRRNKDSYQHNIKITKP